MTVLAVTFIENVHVAFAATLPPFSWKVVPPATPAIVPAPHVVDWFRTAAILSPVGRLTLNITPERATAPATVFSTVTVSVEAPLATMDSGENATIKGIRPSVIVKFAVAGDAFETPWVVASAFVAIVFV